MDNVSDENDYEELPDINISSMAIQPYMFEPTISKEGEKEISETESEHEDESSDGDDQVSQAEEESVIDADDVSLWCSCQKCTTMSTRRESKCCRDTNIVDSKIEEAELDCITEHEGFQVNCLNPYVLETSYYEYLQENGPPDQIIHEVYRHLAYRRFIRWVYQVLGKKNRRVIPSCVVTSIRDKFPSQQYCGFKYPN